MKAVHVSPFQGSWYPEDAAALAGLLDRAFEESRRRAPFVFPGGLGYVVPHAGPMYSGTVAASVYRAIRQQAPSRIIVLAFPHQGGLRGIASPDVEAIATPLGDAAIDSGYGGFPTVSEARVCDHSFEIQLPFLQKAAPQSRITPLYVGHVNAAERASAAAALAALWGPGTVFVASSDFTHFGRDFGFTPFPGDRRAPYRLRELDFDCVEAAATMNSARFLDALRANGATVCGSGPIALLIDTLRLIDPGAYLTALDYQASGEITGDYSHSVSYAALGCFPRAAFDVDARDRTALLDSAAATLAALRRTGSRTALRVSGGSEALEADRGVFVSLHQGAELLGCVGKCQSPGPLAMEAPELTLAAALEDPRFSPAANADGPIDIEISIMTPFRRIWRSEEVQPGRHGLFLRLGKRSGLLLPQVASERGWGAEQFLGALMRKSGVGPQAWRDPDARLYVFEAQILDRKQAA